MDTVPTNLFPYAQNAEFKCHLPPIVRISYSWLLYIIISFRKEQYIPYFSTSCTSVILFRSTTLRTPYILPQLLNTSSTSYKSGPYPDTYHGKTGRYAIASYSIHLPKKSGIAILNGTWRDSPADNKNPVYTSSNPSFSAKTFWKVSELPSAVQTLFLFSLEPIGFAQPSDKWQPPVPQTAGPGVIGFIAKFCWRRRRPS